MPGMRKIGDLIQKAKELKGKGMRVGEIADELNVSRQTAEWLVTQGGKEDESAAPEDLFVDWSPIGSRGQLISDVADAMADMMDEEAEAVVGVAVSGLPLATAVAMKWDVGLAVFHPRKRHWEPGSEEVKGALSSNFLDPEGKSVVVIDDIVTTGSTVKETVESLEGRGCDVLSVAVLVDKAGLERVNGVPVQPLMRVGRV